MTDGLAGEAMRDDMLALVTAPMILREMGPMPEPVLLQQTGRPKPAMLFC